MDSIFVPPIFGIVPTCPSVINSDLQQEMDRRSKTRVDVQLTCLVTADRIEATPLRVITENVSRTGILMRWAADLPLPEVSKTMTVDVQLPENSDFGPRVMQVIVEIVREACGGRSDHFEAFGASGLCHLVSASILMPADDGAGYD